MALGGQAKREYQREYMKQRREARRCVPEWDEGQYPDREAWEIAVARVVRAMVYAEKYPERITPVEVRFQSVAWQYENEGIKMVKPKESVVEK